MCRFKFGNKYSGQRDYKLRLHPTFRGWGPHYYIPSFSGGGQLPSYHTFRGCGQYRQSKSIPGFRSQGNGLERSDSEALRAARAKHCTSSTYQPAEASAGRQAQVFPEELGGLHTGPLGSGNCVRSEARVHTHSLPVLSTSHESVLDRMYVHSRGGPVSPGKRGHSPGATGRGGPVLPFLHFHKDGGRRPIINLKSLNKFIVHHHFKMEGIQSLKDIVLQGDYMNEI